MKIKNKKTGLELIFDVAEAMKMGDLYPDEFEVIPENDEEKKLLKKKQTKEVSLEDKLLGNESEETTKDKEEDKKTGFIDKLLGKD